MARLTARLNAAAGRRLEAKSVTGEDNRTNANATLTPGQYNATAPGRALSPGASAQIQCRLCHCLASWRESTPTPDGSMTTSWRPGPANRRCNWPPPKPPRPSRRLVPGSHRLPSRWQSRPTAPAPGGFMTTWWRPGPANRRCSWPPGEPARLRVPPGSEPQPDDAGRRRCADVWVHSVLRCELAEGHDPPHMAAARGYWRPARWVRDDRGLAHALPEPDTGPQ